MEHVPPYEGPRRPGRPRRATTTQVASAGLRLIHENGYETTSVADIAAAAGIGRSTFFRYFGSKDEILWHWAADQAHTVEATLAAAHATDNPYTAVAHAVVNATRDITSAKAAAAEDMHAIIAERPDLTAGVYAWTHRRLTAIETFMRRQNDTTEVLAVAYAHAIDSALTAAGVLFAQGGRNLPDLVAACVRPIHDGFTTPARTPNQVTT